MQSLISQNTGLKDPNGTTEVTESKDDYYVITDHAFATECKKAADATPEDTFRVVAKELNKIREFSHKEEVTKNMIHPKMSGMLDAIHTAFYQHHPLVLSVSDFILMICQGFADHMRVNAEKLRKEFVDHEGKEEVKLLSFEVPKDIIKWVPTFTHVW